MKIAFIHPDLGIGGAERLVVDMAVAMQNKGHDVTIFTSHHDPKHAFDETVDGTLKVQVLGNSLVPRTLAGRFSILCAILRQLHLTYSLGSAQFDVFIVDQLPATVPYLRLSHEKSRILFYCHHPDLLLTDRKSLAKKLYRIPFDTFERWCTAKSDQIAVNSEYTRKVFFNAFGRTSMSDPSVLYPVVDPQSVVLTEQQRCQLQSTNSEFRLMCSELDPYTISNAKKPGEPRIFLSINRFERKKGVELAISAFAMLLHAHSSLQRSVLIIAGGYDERVPENIGYLSELESLATKFRIPHTNKFPQDSWKIVDLDKTRLLFLPSVGSSEKKYLLENAAALLYTPTNEHFGIVPLEAMCAETPVLATNTGGPLETVVDGSTGWLRKPDMDDWYFVLKQVSGMSYDDLAKMGRAGRERVLKEFTLKNMEELADNLVLKSSEIPRKNEEAVAKNTILVTAAMFMAVLISAFIAYGLLRFLLWFCPIFLQSTQW